MEQYNNKIDNKKGVLIKPTENGCTSFHISRRLVSSTEPEPRRPNPDNVKSLNRVNFWHAVWWMSSGPVSTPYMTESTSFVFLFCSFKVEQEKSSIFFVVICDSTTFRSLWRRRAFPCLPIDGLNLDTSGKYFSST